MNCPKCGNVVADRRTRCEMCGKDLTIYRRTSRLSNSYYNRGLEKAKVRDLTGAILMLKKSLEMNKRNTNARNLLGLVFFEMGETVAALSEWVISKHFQAKDNDADVYMNTISSNPTKLDSMNQAIKKYNIALESAKQGSDDLAIIQLKKVVNLNPHFIRALQLLALIYMKNNEYERAKKCLLRASKIDLTNTTTLRYRDELNQLMAGGVAQPTPYWSDGDKQSSDSTGKALTPISTYREEKPNVWLFVNLVLGVIIGIAAVFFLVVPTVKQNAGSEYVTQINDLNSEMSALHAKLSSAEKEADNYKARYEELKVKLDAIEIPEVDGAMYDNLIKAFNLYYDLNADGSFTQEEALEVADLLYAVKPDSMDLKEAGLVAEKLRTLVYPLAADTAHEQGKKAVEKKDYETGLSLLLKADIYSPDNASTIYYLGKAYQGLGQNDQAKECYNKIINELPNSSFVQYAKLRLEEL
ncbi:MAG: tetratricopeptide repeat protein [Clostridiales bacterium]|nr:tetratricopeptide repeat protein [Clostridiales bacterium]